MGSYKIRVRYGNGQRQSHPAEAVLNEDNKTPPPDRAESGRGSVSEELLYDLVTNMAEMQKQMFDQSQMQIGLLVQMLGSIHQSQQDMLRNELKRVHDISEEMHELQLRLGVQESSQNNSSMPPQALSAEAPPRSSPTENGEDDADPKDPLPAPPLDSRDPKDREDQVAQKEQQTEVPPEDSPRSYSSEVHDHAVLFQRMQNLDRERNSRLQKIFRAFTGSG